MKKIVLLALAALFIIACDNKKFQEPEPEPEYCTLTVVVDIAENISWNFITLKWSYTLVSAEFSHQQVLVSNYDQSKYYGTESKWETTENPSVFVFNKVPKSKGMEDVLITTRFSVKDKNGKKETYDYHFNNGPTMFYVKSDTTIYIARCKTYN